MKKVFLGFGIFISILLVLVVFNAYDRDEAAVKRMMGKLVSALEKGSVEDMRSLFAPFVVESTNKDALHFHVAQLLSFWATQAYSTRLDKAITKCNKDSSKIWASYTNYSISIRPSRNPSISPGIVAGAACP